MMSLMAAAFKLRFDQGEIRHWASQYKNSDESVGLIGEAAKAHGYLTTDDLVTIGRWKSPRTAKRLQSNNEDFIQAVTAAALAARNEQFKIESLTLLRGVDWPTASVILHFCSTDRYPILDFRALWSLSVDVPKAYDFEFWWAYTLFCRSLAERAGMTMRALDRALWQFSKENQIPLSVEGRVAGGAASTRIRVETR